MTGNIVARRYAKALFAIGEKKGEADMQAIGDDLAKLAQVMEDSPEVMRVFRSPIFGAQAKKAVIGQIMDKAEVSETIKNFCNLLGDKDRLAFLPEIAQVYGELLDEAQGVVRGSVVTAYDLSAKRKDEIKKNLEKKSSAKLELGFETNSDILGGVVLKIGDKVLDASLRAQLSILKENITRGV